MGKSQPVRPMTPEDSQDQDNVIDYEYRVVHNLINRQYRHWFHKAESLDNFTPLIDSVARSLLNKGYKAYHIMNKFEETKKRPGVKNRGAYIYRVLKNVEAALASEPDDE